MNLGVWLQRKLDGIISTRLFDFWSSKSQPGSMSKRVSTLVFSSVLQCNGLCLENGDGRCDQTPRMDGRGEQNLQRQFCGDFLCDVTRGATGGMIVPECDSASMGSVQNAKLFISYFSK